MEFVTDSMPSPIGEITVVSDGTALRALDFEGYEARMKKLLERQYGVVTLRRAKDPGGVITALKRYLEWRPVRLNRNIIDTVEFTFQITFQRRDNTAWIFGPT